MLSSDVSSEPWSDPFRDRLGRLAAGRVSDREKPMAVPNDWGIFMAEEPLETLGLEQSEGRRSEKILYVRTRLSKVSQMMFGLCSLRRTFTLIGSHSHISFTNWFFYPLKGYFGSVGPQDMDKLHFLIRLWLRNVLYDDKSISLISQKENFSQKIIGLHY